MFLHKKALYNLIQFNLIKVPHETQLEEWQKDNYRTYPIETLFSCLKKVGIPLDVHAFEEHSKQFETPEQLSEALTKGFIPLDQDYAYLVIFELWRRQFPEKQSLPMFCDELDHQIVQYENQERHSFPEIQDALAALQDLLEKNVDSGIAKGQALSLFQSFCANNLELLLYNYIYDRIEEENYSYAKELLEGFTKYTKDKLFFAYLLARIDIAEDPETGYEKLEKLITHLKEAKNLELSLDILLFLAKTGNHSLFATLAAQTLPWLQTEEDLHDLVSLAAQHFEYLELDILAKAAKDLLAARDPSALSQSLPPGDPALHELRLILRQKVHFATEK